MKAAATRTPTIAQDLAAALEENKDVKVRVEGVASDLASAGAELKKMQMPASLPLQASPPSPPLMLSFPRRCEVTEPTTSDPRRHSRIACCTRSCPLRRYGLDVIRQTCRNIHRGNVNDAATSFRWAY